MELSITWKNSRLTAVPAVHNRAAFAARINGLCMNADTRPDAIAVELEPDVLALVKAWLRELTPPGGPSGMLPCMPGLLLNAGREDKDSGLVCLSATDSIIEAVRCGIELNIPVVGIDAPGYPDGSGVVPMIEDPFLAWNNLETFVSNNEKAANECRDALVDLPRELVMAGMLKHIMKSCRKVLYTGGLAHWESIKMLMSREDVPARKNQSFSDIQNVRRVILHPLIAIRFMDFFPVATTLYEWWRGTDPAKRAAGPGFDGIGRQVVDISLRQFEEGNSNGGRLAAATSAQADPVGFSRMLQAMQLLNRQATPCFQTTLAASESMMPARFSGIMARHIMDIHREWASPLTHRDLSVLVPSTAARSCQSMPREGEYADIYEPVVSPAAPSERIYQYAGTVFLPCPASSGPGIPAAIRQWNWEDDPRHSNKAKTYYTWAWPPCESLLYGTAFQAHRIALQQETEAGSAVFEGSMNDGLHLRETMRSVIRGENKIHTRLSKNVKRAVPPDGKSPEPTVFLFTQAPADESLRWSMLVAGSTVAQHVEDVRKMEEATGGKGSYFIASIAMESQARVRNDLKKYADDLRVLSGITVFGHPCLNSAMSAMWLEENNFTCCPVLHYDSMSNLLTFYSEEHQMDIDPSDWPSALIRFAIPYARNRVVVVGPDHYSIPRALLAEASRRKINLDFLPLSCFPAERVEEMRQRLMVPSTDTHGRTFPAALESLLGQSPDCYLNLLPEYMRQQYKRSVNSRPKRKRHPSLFDFY